MASTKTVPTKIPIKPAAKPAKETKNNSVVGMQTGEQASKPNSHHPHVSRKIGEMIIVVAMILLFASCSMFVVVLLTSTPTVNNFYIYGHQSQSMMNGMGMNGSHHSASMAGNQPFQQVNAPTGKLIAGFPENLVPTGAPITASYQNRYNGFDQYTASFLNTAKLTTTFTTIEKLLTSAGYKISPKSGGTSVPTATSKTAMINAKQETNYVTVQLQSSTSASTTAVTVNYGVPIK